ncbi:MAG TPA: DNA starvation/stationary phase protection protein [Bdellovibrionales bacterium]|nr:DNA starvation/stationary phase protection protein [Bdellovibrionales bacterium]
MTKKQADKLDIETDRAESTGSNELKRVLADTFVLYMKTYAVHWNFKGPRFFSVHKLTEEHYGELAEAIDEIAERIRAKGVDAPVSLEDILAQADLSEMKRQENATSDRALTELIAGHELLAKRAKEAAEVLDEAGDLFSCDMMTARIGAHDKAAWMLRSFLNV